MIMKLEKESGLSVVPHAGTWIEIIALEIPLGKCLVVPHAGTWIEILSSHLRTGSFSVVPHAGTWIEIASLPLSPAISLRRSPRGNVD